MKLLAIILLFALSLNAQVPFERPATDTLLVKHREDDGNGNARAALHRTHGVSQTHRYQSFPWSVIKLPLNANPHAVRKAYRESGLFESVQTPMTYYAEVTPNDTLYSQLWGLTKIQAPMAWDSYKGSNNVVVAVIDTGVSYTHADLRDNMWTDPVTGAHGYTAFNGTIAIGGNDDHYHGTHVAGTIGAVGNNALGVAGINWHIQILALKFLTASGSGTSVDAALCVDKMIELKRQGVPIRVSNNSWGGSGYDDILYDAFQAAEQNGILNICASGNSAVDTDSIVFSPAALPLDSILSVLASDQQDNKAFFSNYGSRSTDLLAPGVSILSCKPGDAYQILSGTSMASPHVCGVAAALFALNPAMTHIQCKNLLLDPGSYDLTAFKQCSTGGGRLNFNKAIHNPKLNNPPELTNQPPTMVLSVTNGQVFPIGQRVTVTATATDPNGDDLTFNGSLKSEQDLDWDYLQSRTLGFYYRTNTGEQNFSFTAQPLAIDVAPVISYSVTDGHGGGDSIKATGFVYHDESKVRDLSKSIQSFSASYDPNTFQLRMRLQIDTNIVAVEDCTYAYWFMRNDRDVAESTGFKPNEDIVTSAPLENPGVNTGRAILMDKYGNSAVSEQTVIYLGRTATPPNIRLALNTSRGAAPLSIVGDMSGTAAQLFQYGTWRKLYFSTDTYNPVQRLTISQLGTYAIAFRAFNTNNQTGDMLVRMISILPVNAPPSPTNPPPPNVILDPPNDLNGLVNAGRVTLTWSDTATGETKWEVWRSTKAKGPWGAWGLVSTQPADSRSYQQSVNRNTSYQFKVQACTSTQCGGYSNVEEFRVR